MKISINTETEEIEELRHAVAILEDAIKRRENPDFYEEEDSEEEPEARLAEKEVKEEAKQPEQKPIELKLTRPEPVQVQQPQVQQQQAQPQQQTQQPQMRNPMQPIPSMRPRERAPDVDMSALTMSDFGQRKENRSMSGGGSSSHSHSYSSSPQPAYRQEQPRSDSKSAMKNIISSLRNQRPGQPIQMSDIVTKARERSISENEARNLVSELQREGSI